jgi:tetratricopeptide (TPR) repeat protein
MLRWLWLVAAAAAIWVTQDWIDARGRAGGPQRLLVRSGETLRKLFPGLETILADVYWLRAVQYYGSQGLSPSPSYELLEPLIGITTTLDPRFLVAYRYGAIFLAEDYPRGAGRPDAAAELLERGIDRNPQAWQLRWELGILRYLFQDDPVGAGEVLQQAAALPGAPYWLETMAGRMAVSAGRRDTARLIWLQLYQLNEGAIRANALLNLQYLDVLDAFDVLRDRIRRYAERFGEYPARLADVQREGGVTASLADPTGVPFRYDSSTGKVGIGWGSALWFLQPEEEREWR